MNHAKRAAIASAFIYPGAGLFLLKHYVRGCIFAIPATLIVVAMMMDLLQAAAALQQDIQGESLTPALIQHLWTSLHTALYESRALREGIWILLASWVLSIISSYFAGKKQDVAISAKTTNNAEHD